MNTRSSKNGISTSTYRQTLAQAMKLFLTAPLFVGLRDLAHSSGRKSGWTLRQMVFQCVLMAFDPSPTLTDRFAGARRVLREMFPRHKGPGRTYQGWSRPDEKYPANSDATSKRTFANTIAGLPATSDCAGAGRRSRWTVRGWKRPNPGQ